MENFGTDIFMEKIGRDILWRNSVRIFLLKKFGTDISMEKFGTDIFMEKFGIDILWRSSVRIFL
jgi:hypothetical protein